jgi:DNA (cytosine-5)-methyltransferase 1
MLIGRQLADDSRQDSGGHEGDVGIAPSQLAGVRVTKEQAALLQSYPTHLKVESVSDIIALDLFAGTGWGVACRWLGIDEYGVDNMPEVIETRAANDMSTIFHDVWTGLLDGLEGGIEVPGLSLYARDIINSYNTLIASPPCQTFSQAGAGAGRKALNQVIAAIDEGRYKDPADLYKLSEETDPKTALVLTPMAYAYRDRPQFVVLEQVPPVLPVWEACAVELRKIGYSVVTGILNAEQYGVPQTRKRAILIARRDGVEAQLPVPTHSKYYNRDPKRLDPGVLPWVSMAEALGWGTTEKPSYTVTGGGAATGGAEPFGNGARAGMVKAMEEGGFSPRGAALSSGIRDSEPLRRIEEPATTQAYGHNAASMRWTDLPEDEETIRDVVKRSDEYLTIDEAAALQSYPSQWSLRSNYGTNGDPADRGERTQDEPAATITSKANRNKWIHGGPKTAEAAEAAVRELQERTPSEEWKWRDTPSTTIAGDPRITAREHHFHGEQNSTSFRLDLEEAAQLQSYPPFVWKGKKGSTFLQIGNAVPPILAKAILETLL